MLMRIFRMNRILRMSEYSVHMSRRRIFHNHMANPITDGFSLQDPLGCWVILDFWRESHWNSTSNLLQSIAFVKIQTGIEYHYISHNTTQFGNSTIWHNLTKFTMKCEVNCRPAERKELFGIWFYIFPNIIVPSRPCSFGQAKKNTTIMGKFIL